MLGKNDIGEAAWWRFWSQDSWTSWWERRGPWREYRRAARAGGVDATLMAPPRPISPAWVPASVLGLALVFGPGTEPANPAPPPVTAVAATSSTSVVSTATTEASPTTIATPASTTTSSTSTTSTTQTTLPDPLFVGAIVGDSGDPSQPPPDAAEVVVVTEIVDGDTMHVRREDGGVDPLRLIGINSPESNECFAAEATRALAVLAPVGTEVAVTIDVNERDDFDRLLRYVWVGGFSVNEELVRRGAAISRRYPPDTALADRFEQAQNEARDQQLGVWAPDACGPASGGRLRTIEVNYDAPGDDSKNLNEEWIRIANRGDGPVDLTGWTVKDESATHRFSFPAGFVLAAGEIVTIRTGCGEAFGTELFWCATGSAVWNNDGDTVSILDPHGNTHHSHSYSPPTTTTSSTVTTTTPVRGIVGGTCDPSYPDVCIPPYPPDLDCGDISHRRFKVVGSDPHGFDGDNDGVGCES